MVIKLTMSVASDMKLGVASKFQAIMSTFDDIQILTLIGEQNSNTHLDR
jgi:hypothetical protein